LNQDRLVVASPAETDSGLGVEFLISAGEASGDLHAARLLQRLLGQDPSLRAFGMGGPELRSAGMEVVADSSEISVVGITEALKILPRARQIFDLLVHEVVRRKATVAILVDFPDFNLRLAKALKRRGVRVVYYISPQVWAWRRRRVRTIAKVVDLMLVVLPFEVDFYRDHGVPAIHVGHPLVDEVPELPQIWDRPQADQEPLRLALLPGSRKSELEANLPVMIETAELLAKWRKLDCAIVKASSISTEQIYRLLEVSSLRPRIASDRRFEALSESHLALCASGTATLEVGLLTTPMIVIYRVHAWTYLLGRMLVRLPHISLVNLVLKKEAVPELIQGQAVATKIYGEARSILEDRDRIERMRRDLALLRPELGESGASAKASAHVMEILAESRSAAEPIDEVSNESR